MTRLHAFLPIFMGASLFLSIFTISSCNGNGGASDAGGEIYMGGGYKHRQ
ncbi:MAG: hypothetical protein K6G18_13120 [Treponema sp.]|nr:hypothetical protein [Treponema sp.]